MDSLNVCLFLLRLLFGFPFSFVWRVSRFLIVSSCPLCSLFFISPRLRVSCRHGRAERHRVVLVVCDRLTWEDVNAECPFLVGLMDRARVGLMNTAVAGPKNVGFGYAALAPGRPWPRKRGTSRRST